MTSVSKEMAIPTGTTGLRLASLNMWGTAACRGPHQEIFFPPTVTETRRAKRRREARAKEICGICPIVENCLSIALQRNEQHGIWGGQTEKERRVLVIAANQLSAASN